MRNASGGGLQYTDTGNRTTSGRSIYTDGNGILYTKDFFGDGYSSLGTTYSGLSGLTKFTINGSDYIQKPNKQQIVDDILSTIDYESQPPTKTSTENPKPAASTQSPTFMGVKAGGNVKAKGNFGETNNPFTEDQKQMLISTGRFTSDDFNSVKSLQTALNRYVGGTQNNGILADNKWGNQTQKAFDEALRQAEIYKQQQTPQQSRLPETPIQTTFSKIQFTPDFSTGNAGLEKAQERYILNKAQTRNLMKSAGMNPYDYSGSFRKALKLRNNGQNYNKSILNGVDLTKFDDLALKMRSYLTPVSDTSIRNQMMQDIIDKNNNMSLTSDRYFKKGGLISKDPVKRFKQKFQYK